MVWTTILLTLFTWFVGLVLDANIGYGETLGFTDFRVLFPVLTVGLCILSEIRKLKEIKNSQNNTDEKSL